MRSEALALRTRRRGVVGVPLAGLLAVASAGALGQDATPQAGAGAVLVPRIAVTQTWTDNVALRQTDPRSEQITEISPGLHLQRTSGPLRGYVDYALSAFVYAQGSAPRRSANTLNAQGTLEALEGRGFLDVSGSISQQAISAFGPQSLDQATTNANRTEVSSLRMSPYVRGNLGSQAYYEARYSRAVTQGEAASGVASNEGLLQLGSHPAVGPLGWSAELGRQQTDYSAGRSTEADHLDLGLSYAVTPQLALTVNVGQEGNNFTSQDKAYAGTHGVGVRWFPSPLTRFAAARAHHSFGDTHSLSLEHRSARTIWRFSDMKEVSVTPNQTGLASLGSVYELLFSQFASLEPNEVARAQLVNAYLQATGLSANAVLLTSFLASSLAMQRRQDASFALLGVRDTITFFISRSELHRLDTVSTALDDFTQASRIRQHGVSVNYAHRLTPQASLGVMASQQRLSAQDGTQDMRLNSLQLTLTARVAKQVTGSVSARRVLASGNTAPYAENAIMGTLTVQF